MALAGEPESTGKSTSLPRQYQPNGSYINLGGTPGNPGGGRPKEIQRALLNSIATKTLKKVDKGLDDGSVTITEATPFVKAALVMADDEPAIIIESTTLAGLFGEAITLEGFSDDDKLRIVLRFEQLVKAHAREISADVPKAVKLDEG